MLSGIGNPNAGGAGFRRLTGKRRVVDPVSREEDWEEWLESLSPEERAVVDQNERLNQLDAHLWNNTQRMVDTGCGDFDEEGNFVEGFAGRTTVWDKDPDSRWILHQCPISDLPAAILRKERFLHSHPGWFRDRPIFESIYKGMVKKSLDVPLSDFEYAELGRLYMRYQHVLTAEPLTEFIEYFLLQRGIELEDLFTITQAIHEVGTVYEFDALGRSKSSGIGDMALEVIKGEYDDDDFEDFSVSEVNAPNLSRDSDAGASVTADDSVESDLPDP